MGTNPSSISESVALCQLADNVCVFIEEYKGHTLSVAKDLAESLDHKISTYYRTEYEPWMETPLSTREHGRLQRALCRFEIYRSLFARCTETLNHESRSGSRKCLWEPVLTPDEQGEFYLAQYPDYQVEEIACVRDYLFRRLRGALDGLEHHYTENLSLQVFTFGRGVDWECALDSSGYYLFSRRGKHDQSAHLEHLMSLGLPYVRRILQSSSRGKTQRDLLIRHTYPVWEPHRMAHNFITEALSGCIDNPAAQGVTYREEGDPPWEYEMDEEIELGLPDAWQWANPEGPPPTLGGEGAFRAFRDFGYVFWDKARLQESGIYRRTARQIQLHGGYHELETRFDASVEDKLRLGPEWEAKFQRYPSSTESDVDSEDEASSLGESSDESLQDSQSSQESSPEPATVVDIKTGCQDDQHSPITPCEAYELDGDDGEQQGPSLSCGDRMDTSDDAMSDIQVQQSPPAAPDNVYNTNDVDETNCGGDSVTQVPIKASDASDGDRPDQQLTDNAQAADAVDKMPLAYVSPYVEDDVEDEPGEEKPFLTAPKIVKGMIEPQDGEREGLPLYDLNNVDVLDDAGTGADMVPADDANDKVGGEAGLEHVTVNNAEDDEANDHGDRGN